MNETILTQLKIIVERAVRPVKASMYRKRKMREELLSHVSAVFEQEAAKLGEEDAALKQTALRFGNPVELAVQLQKSVPTRDIFDGFADWAWYRPGEFAIWRALRHAMLIDALGVAIMLTFWLGLFRWNSWPPEATRFTASLVPAVFVFVFGFTFLAEKMRKALYEPTGRSWRRAAVVAVATLLPLFGLVWGLGQDVIRWNYMDFMSLLIMAPFTVICIVGMAYGTALQNRYDQEWANLPIE